LSPGEGTFLLTKLKMGVSLYIVTQDTFHVLPTKNEVILQ